MLKKLLTNSSTMMSGQLTNVAITLVQSVLLARGLGPDQFGRWALLIATSSLVMNFLAFRTSEALTSYWIEAKLDRDARSGSAYLTSAIMVELGTKSLSAILSIGIGLAVLGWNVMSFDVVMAAALVGVYRLFQFADAVWLSLARADKRIRTLAVVPVIQASAQLVLISILMQFLQLNLILVGISFALPSLFLMALKLRQISEIASELGSSPLDMRAMRDHGYDPKAGFWHMMMTGYLSSCLTSLMKEGDTLVVGFVASDASVGFYRLARSLISVVQMATQTLATLVLQDFAEIRRKGPDAILSVVKNVALPFAGIVLVGCAAVAVLLPHIVKLVYGEAYLGAVSPFRILLVGTAAATSLFWVRIALVALRENKANLYISVVNFIVYVIAMGLGLHFLKGLGPAVATSSAWVFGHVVSFFWLMQVIKRQRKLAAT